MRGVWLLILAIPAFAQTITLTVQNKGQIRAGDTLVLQAALSGAPPVGAGMGRIAALQLSLTSNRGGTWTSAAGPAAVAAGKHFDCALSGSDYTCVISGMNQNAIEDGALGTFSLAIPNGAQGALSITADNQMGATGDGGLVSAQINQISVQVKK